MDKNSPTQLHKRLIWSMKVLEIPPIKLTQSVAGGEIDLRHSSLVSETGARYTKSKFVNKIDVLTN